MAAALLAHFRMMAHYNRLANERLYAACARLGDAERKATRGALFGSIHGTLNHILVGDRIWLARFGGETVLSTDLDAILYQDFAALRAARAEEDARIEDFAAGLDLSFLEGEIEYVNNESLRLSDPKPLLLAHLFNHQTHHRGQIHDLLCQSGAEAPVLDLHRVLRPSPGGR